ncbi:MAG: hypothetical protein RR404_02065 [Bacilli bacterium]
MKCKRCGSLLNIENQLCKGCGKSLADLRANNEIIFDDDINTQSISPIVNLEPSTTSAEAPTEVENIDIFGDAVLNNFTEQENSLKEVSNDLNSSVILEEKDDFSDLIEDNVVEVPVETINSVPLINQPETVNVESAIIKAEEIETIDINDIIPIKKKKLKLALILAIVAFAVVIAGGIFVYLFFIAK